MLSVSYVHYRIVYTRLSYGMFSNHVTENVLFFRLSKGVEYRWSILVPLHGSPPSEAVSEQKR